MMASVGAPSGGPTNPSALTPMRDLISIGGAPLLRGPAGHSPETSEPAVDTRHRPGYEAGVATEHAGEGGGSPLFRQVVLDGTDARQLAEFYRQLLGWQYRPGDELPAP